MTTATTNRKMTEEERRKVSHALTAYANELDDEADEVARQAVAKDTDRADAARVSTRLHDRAYELRRLSVAIFTGEVG